MKFDSKRTLGLLMHILQSRFLLKRKTIMLHVFFFFNVMFDIMSRGDI